MSKEDNNMKATFEMEKVTKNTIRFTEKLDSITATPVIGTMYIPKTTLQAIGWSEGKQLVVELSAK